ncbi:MAG TPA: bacteriohemerythrin [Tenuifilaceae bacterium]|nr:bacteriohemerythrin [Tenuifilaceae bacterium]HQQ29583.1 bacteriohemerythrin [Tenuifilaceae bacterium]
MELISWESNYSVKVGSIDADHKKLVEILNSLFMAMSKGEGSKIISDLVKELQRYTIYHFSREESFFRITGYPNTQKHIEEHKQFIGKVKEYKEKVDKGNNDFSPEMLAYLKDWLLNHILVTDKAYSEHFVKHGIA